MIGVLVISLEPLGTAMIQCTRHIFGRMPPQLAALDVIPDEDPARALEAARALVSRINDGSGDNQNTIMVDVAKHLTDEEIRSLAINIEGLHSSREVASQP